MRSGDNGKQRTEVSPAVLELFRGNVRIDRKYFGETAITEKKLALCGRVETAKKNV
jgi:hypothetical protein